MNSDGWIDLERRHGYIQIRLRLASTDNGGPRGPIPTGWRSPWELERSNDDRLALNDAQLIWEDGLEKVGPGEEALARLHPLSPDHWRHVRSGMRIYAYQGTRRVGEALVTDRLTGQSG